MDVDKVGSRNLQNPVSCTINRLLISPSNLHASETGAPVGAFLSIVNKR